MKTKALAGSLFSILLAANSALAAGGREDNSGLVVWIFLGFCALIVVAQLIPAVLMAVGLIKGISAGAEASEPARENVRH